MLGEQRKVKGGRQAANYRGAQLSQQAKKPEICLGMRIFRTHPAQEEK